MGRFIVLLSVTLTLISAIPAFAQWGGYGSGYGMARRAASYGQSMARRHANRMLRNRRNRPKKTKQKKDAQDDQPASKPDNELPKQQNPGNMSPSSDYPEWPPPNAEKQLPPTTPSGF